MRPHLLLLPILALPLALMGCINTDAAVFVEPSILSPKATVAGGALGVTISGEFKLNLHLGPRASGPADVALGGFAILDVDKKAEITSIQLGDSAIQFPTAVEPDVDALATFPFDLGSKTLPATAKDKAAGSLCDPRGVILRGTIQDSLAGGSTPFFSEIIHPAGCM